MTKSFFLVLLLCGFLAVGCSNSNKAATSDNNSGQPAAASSNNPSSSANNSSSSSSSSTSSSNPDQQFINDAAKGNRAEVELGKLVESKATDPNVKQFAKMMQSDHAKALSQLEQVAQSKNMTLPDGIPDDAQDLETKLSSESGKQLEKDYMDGMVKDHQKDVQEFQDATNNLQDNDVKQWAEKTLPTLQKHLKKAQQVDLKVGGQAGSKTQAANQQ
jgi:putative membrane protein